MYENAKEGRWRKIGYSSIFRVKQIKRTYLLNFDKDMNEFVDNDLEKIINNE